MSDRLPTVTDGKTGEAIPYHPAPNDSLTEYLLMLVSTMGFEAARSFLFGRFDRP